MDGLPVLSSFVSVYGEVARKGLALLKALIVPAIAIVGVEWISLGYPSRFPYTLLFWSLSAPFYVLFAVVCHRLVILGVDSLPSTAGLFWTERETRFLGWTIALTMLGWGGGLLLGVFYFVVPEIILGMRAPWLPGVTVMLIAAYFFLRFSLVFPATAIDHKTSLVDTWDLTAGNGLRLMVLVALSVAPIILLFVFSSLFTDSWTSGAQIALATVFWQITSVFAISSVSIAYRELSGVDYLEVAP